MLHTLLLLIPLLGVFTIATGISYELSHSQINRIKTIVLTTSIINLVISLIVFILFDFSSNQFQSSIHFVMLISLITPFALLSNWNSIYANAWSCLIRIYLFVINYPLLAIRIAFYIFFFTVGSDVFLDNTLLSTNGNPLPPTGGSINPQAIGGGNPPTPTGGNRIMPHILLNDDMEPIEAQRLRNLYNKLGRLHCSVTNPDPNRGLTMNSPDLSPDLVFTSLDRTTMHDHISRFHPDYAHRFKMTRQGYSFTSRMSSEILSLFRPDTIS